MRAIIIGAGCGSRLKALTENQPKCYVPIGRRRILDWILEAFEASGLDDDRGPVFIGGYRIDLVRSDYPHLIFCHNAGWQNNNILASLFHADQYMHEGFVCSYADILFRATIVLRALEHPSDIVLCVDTHWRDRYADRSQHPENDAEKVVADGDRIVQIGRGIDADQADGEYIGVAKFTAQGARQLREHYHRVRRQFTGKTWSEDKPFEKAYLIQLFQEMIERGMDIRMVTTQCDYMEIDTEEDYELANRDWPG